MSEKEWGWFQLKCTNTGEHINWFHTEERAERKRDNLIDAWPEHTEESMEIVEHIGVSDTTAEDLGIALR